MSSDVLEFSAVTKRYSRYGGLLRVKNFLDRVKNGQFRDNLVREPDFFALRDVSFRLQRGEKLGIIGPNGAGKSTALKLIQGVATPTSGEVRVVGKVGGLIELGTGFHQDLTGRENVYLNTAINGLSRKETDSLIDKIIEISEIEHFIDVPLKRYSSGMKVRLGFAVAMVFVPDVVLLDEVLAVGDARFKEKSMQMIQDYLEGRSLIFVSHSMSQVRRVCDRVLVLFKGEVVFDGRPNEAIKVYEDINKGVIKTREESVIVQRKVKRGFAAAPRVEVRSVVFTNARDTEESMFEPGDAVHADIALLGAADANETVVVKIQVKSMFLSRFSDVVSSYSSNLSGDMADGRTLRLSFGTSTLRAGDYILEVIPELQNQSAKSSVVVFRKPFRLGEVGGSQTNGLLDLGFHLDGSAIQVQAGVDA